MANEAGASFVGLLGESPKVKMWEFLLVSRGNFEYNIKDISNGSGITRPTCHKEIKDFMGKKIVVKGGKYRGKQLYKLNIKSIIVKNMLRSFHSMIYNN